MNTLPPEIIEIILNQVKSIKDMTTISMVSKQLAAHTELRVANYWRERMTREFPHNRIKEIFPSPEDAGLAESSIENLMELCESRKYPELHRCLTLNQRRYELLNARLFSINRLKKTTVDFLIKFPNNKTELVAFMKRSEELYAKSLAEIHAIDFEETMSWAAHHGKEYILIDLIRAYKKGKITKLGVRALRSAVHTNEIQCAKILIDAGTDVNLDDPLRVAIGHGNIPLVKLLMESGANVHSRGWGPSNFADRYTLLMRAADERNTEIILLLLAAGVDANATGSFRNVPDVYVTALWVCSQSNKYWEKRESASHLLRNSRKIQAQIFCDELCPLPPEKADNVMKKINSAGLLMTDLLNHIISSAPIKGRIEYINIALERDKNGEPTNGLAYYLKSKSFLLKKCLDQLLETSPNHVGTFRGTIHCARPFLPSHGPQRSMDPSVNKIFTKKDLTLYKL